MCRPRLRRPVGTFSPRQAVGDQRPGTSGRRAWTAPAFDAPCRRGCPARGRRGHRPRSEPSISSNPRGFWITDKEHEAVRALSRSADQLRDSSWLESSGVDQVRPMQRHPSARGAVWKTVATGCAGSTPGLCTTPATRDVAQPAARRWQRRRRGFDPPPSPPAPAACPCRSGDRAPACEAGGRRFKFSRSARMFAVAGDELADRIGLVGSLFLGQPGLLDLEDLVVGAGWRASGSARNASRSARVAAARQVPRRRRKVSACRTAMR